MDCELFAMNVDNIQLQCTICEPKLDKINDGSQNKLGGNIDPIFYHDADVAILVYDVTYRNSFKVLEKYANEIASHTGRSDCVKLVVGNKIDLVESSNKYQAVLRVEARSWAYEREMLFAECSATTGENVISSFEQAIRISSVYCNTLAELRYQQSSAKLAIDEWNMTLTTRL